MAGRGGERAGCDDVRVTDLDEILCLVDTKGGVAARAPRDHQVMVKRQRLCGQPEARPQVEHRHDLTTHVDGAFDNGAGGGKRCDGGGTNNLTNVGRAERETTVGKSDGKQLHQANWGASGQSSWNSAFHAPRCVAVRFVAPIALALQRGGRTSRIAVTRAPRLPRTTGALWYHISSIVTPDPVIHPQSAVASTRGSGFSLPWSASSIVGLILGWIALSQLRSGFELWPGVSVWYPPVALLVAACIVWGPRAVVPIFAGALLLAHRFAGPADPWWRIILVSLALKLSYVAGVLALRRWEFDPGFARPRDVSLFAGVISAAALFAALIGTADAFVDGSIAAGGAPQTVLIFWLGDVVAILALSPVLLAAGRWWSNRRLTALATARPAGVRRLTVRRATVRQDVVLVVSVPVVLWLAFGFAPQLGFLAYAICFIPLGWTALTHGTRGAAVMTAVLDIGAIVLLRWFGLLPRDNFEVQTFMASLAVTGLFLGSVADERERGRVLLAQSEERYRALIELLPDPLVVHRDGKVLFANNSAARTFGVAQAEIMVGLKLADLADPASRELVEHRVHRLNNGESLEVAEHRFRRLDGSGSIDLEASSQPIPFGDGFAALTVARDVTERKRLEAELRHSQRMESVGRLAGGVAHDFNNLLTIIISYGQLLLAELEPGAITREYAQETLDAAGRAAALTRQLLTFSRKQVLQAKPLRLDTVVEGTEKLLRRLLGPDIVFITRLDPRSGIVLADPTQLDQVIVNLAVNARDAMPNGGRLVIETGALVTTGSEVRWPALAAGGYATLTVSDTGTGMDATVRSHVFDPFYTTKDESRGTGLGLATVYGIVTQAGGSIFVESTVGVGTQFTIFLPQRGAADEQRPLEGDITGEAHPQRPASARLLLAEDDEHVRIATRRLLAAAGYTVTDACDGRAALAAYDSANPPIDVIVTDMSMPEMNGRELSRVLRGRGDNVPILLVSGFVDPLHDLELDYLTVLQKPVDAAALVTAVETALRAR